MSRLLDIKDAADLLGIHPETLRDWARNRTIKASKAGRLWRISQEAIEEYLRDHSNVKEGDAK